MSPRFVLIRGLAREAGHWHDFDRRLRERFADATVERHDLPGNGARWREPSPLAVATMAADLRARVQAADRRAPVLIAVSLGAMVCLEWLRRHREDPIDGLVAINTSVGGICKPWERIRAAAWVPMLRAILEPDPIARELAILELTTSEHRHDRRLAGLHAAIHHERPIGRSNVLRQMVAAARFRTAGWEPAAPLLLLGSARDRLVNPRCSAEIARMLAARVELHPSAGHDLTLDDPSWCAERILEWLEPPTLSRSGIECSAGADLG